MARFEGFVGGSYKNSSLKIACDRAINIYPEREESPTAASPMSFLNCPGYELFTTLPGGTGPPMILTLFASNNRLWAMCGTNLYEIYSDGTKQLLWTLGFSTPTNPALMVSNGIQIAIYDGASTLWLYDMGQGNPPPTNVLDDVRDVCFVGGYFIALRGLDVNGGNQINISALYDGTSWDPLDEIIVRSSNGDILQRVLADHNQLILLGAKSYTTYVNTGGSGTNAFPFEIFPPGCLDLGVWAPWSPARIDDSLFFLAGDTRGVATVVRMNGYQPQRVSNLAVEQAMETYRLGGQDTSDAIGYSYREAGHSFYVLTFPTANKTWAYDVTTKQWHERGKWNGASFDPDATLSQHPGRYHAWGSPAQKPGPINPSLLRINFGGTGYAVNDTGVIINGNISQFAGTILTTSINAGGSGYALTDTGFIDAGNGKAAYQVTGVSGGAVTAILLTNAGINYQATTGVGTTTGGFQPGAGTGLKINVLTVSNPSGLATYKVTSVDTDGAVLALTMLTDGDLFFTNNGIATVSGGAQPGIGNGLRIDIVPDPASPSAAHFLGDYSNGNIYKSSVGIFTDDGDPKLFQRTAPHLVQENKVNRYRLLEILFEQGIISGGTPNATLEISNDGGQTFGPQWAVPLGASGDYTARARWMPLGAARDRVFRLTRTDANKQSWVDGYLDVQPGDGT